MRIWFNQGHTLFQTLSGMERRVPGVTLVVSASHAMSPASMAGSEAWVEPEGLRGDPYVQWALDRARQGGIDVFFPQKEVLSIAGRADLFRAAGVRLELPAEAGTIRLLDDKAAMADDLAGDDVLAPTWRARSAEDVERAVRQIRALGVEACVKPAHGVFARGYWHLVDGRLLDCLDDVGSRRMPLDTYLSALREAEAQGERLDLVVMQHLPGSEASVDVHARDGRLLRAVTRIKIRSSRQMVVGGHGLVPVVERLIGRYRLNGVVNVQFKPDADGAWKILEINPRMAGGLSYAMPLGVDLAADWVKAATGGRVDRVDDSFQQVVNFHTQATIRSS
jgi:hypothetical protein